MGVSLVASSGPGPPGPCSCEIWSHTLMSDVKSFPAFVQGLFMLCVGSLVTFAPATAMTFFTMLCSPLGMTPPSVASPGAAYLGLALIGYGVNGIHAGMVDRKASVGCLCAGGTMAGAAAAAAVLQVSFKLARSFWLALLLAARLSLFVFCLIRAAHTHALSRLQRVHGCRLVGLANLASQLGGRRPPRIPGLRPKRSDGRGLLHF